MKRCEEKIEVNEDMDVRADNAVANCKIQQLLMNLLKLPKAPQVVFNNSIFPLLTL